MDLFDRYLHAVRGYLPKGQQDDVVRELSEDLQSQAEEQEAQLGRPLYEGEQAQILKQLGHPLLLASRYQPKRQLVGPAVFPIYWFVLKIALGVTLLVHVISAAIFFATGRPPEEAMSGLLRITPFLMTFAWVTLVFAVLDRAVLKLSFVADWNPVSLPMVQHESDGASMWCRVGEIAVTVAFLLWLAAIPRNQWVIFGPAWTLIQLGPSWFDVYIPILILVAASLLVMVITLRHPERRKLRSLTRVVTNVFSMAIMLYLVRSHDLVVAVGSAGEGAESLAALLTTLLRVCLGVAVFGITFETVREMLRLYSRGQARGNWSTRAS